MKILYLLFSFTVGGTERLVTDICNQMVKNNDVYLYIVNDLVSDELISTLDPSINVFLQGRQVGERDKLKTLVTLAKYVKVNEIEIVHCNSFDAPELTVFCKLFSPEVKIVHTIHGLNQYKKLSKVRVFIRNRLCDSFIGISQAVVNDIRKYGASDKKISLIYNGVDENKYINKISLKKKNEVRKIACVARIMPEIKGQDVLIAAAKKISQNYPEVCFEFAGGVAESEKGNYEKLIKQVSSDELDDKVRFLGLISDIPQYLESVDICVIPSREEGFGLSMVEAMSMGIPCVASDIGGLAEIVNKEKIGTLFKCGDSKDLAEKLEYAIKNYVNLKEEAEKKRLEIQYKYSIQNMCENLEQHYRMLMEK